MTEVPIYGVFQNPYRTEWKFIDYTINPRNVMLSVPKLTSSNETRRMAIHLELRKVVPYICITPNLPSNGV